MTGTVAKDRVQGLPLISAVPLSKRWSTTKLHFSEISDDERSMELAQGSIPLADFVISNVQPSASVIIAD